jgi:L-alanine-DL-glutamate epimerase-like enolase superfamily enzyme
VPDALDGPVSSGEQEHTRWQFRDLIRLGNPDILQPGIVMAGGISEVRRIFDLATAFDKPIMPRSGHIRLAVSYSASDVMISFTLDA